MVSWIYDYVDGAPEGVRQGIGVDVTNFHNMNGCISIRSKMSGSDDFSIDIPTKNIVEIQHFTVEENKKTNKGIYAIGGAIALGALTLTPVGAVIAGAKAVAAGVTASAVAMAGGGAIGGAVGGVFLGNLTDYINNAGKENVFMIAYLEESNPENLQAIVLEHSKTFLKDVMKFFDTLIEQDATIKKS